MTEKAVRLTDPAALRALAHPTRIALLGELRGTGPSTVGRLSVALDEAAGSISYHLRRLAAVGLVAEAPELAVNRRERWWRAEHQLTAVLPAEDRTDPERAAAGTALRREIARGLAALQEAYLDAEASLPPEWIAAATQGDRLLHLTVAELSELSAELDELADRWQDRSDRGRPGTEQVALLTAAFRRPGRSTPSAPAAGPR
ncbi:DNA-binding transcriptional ArsR family regulator [Kineococcus radiotolerans]|uniref:DNA-binding transcriptional ArsR family regulator n=1 Tax=Kineococcus radiotolerans TaxID=131568 RepID=A0A7W4XVN3_KINRA|nr:helix-turn-helix domain-containing protein [Kineococcus radiotolerans]MBB2899359.1 DNA-binding transcriptional ArsR family regulator [Kineococcus radiotolerans]